MRMESVEMAYQDRYGIYLEQLKNLVETAKNSAKTLVFGYTSNYDVVLKWDVDAYNEILRKYLKAYLTPLSGKQCSTRLLCQSQ